ncbi:MAG: hydrogenase maturation protease [Deltaproteobacteria bacterium]|nr:hydrogenase maturation protease [Deltaproteobacteria bacterium]
MQIFEKSVLIFGCGNILWGDDGFGPAVIEHLNQHYPLPDDVLARDVGTSIRDTLFDLILSEPKPKLLVIVDAVDHPDRRPGEVFEIPVEGIPAHKISDFSLHQFPTVNMLQEIKEKSGMQVKIIVARTESIPEEVAPGLSESIQRAVPLACEQIMAAIKAVRN